MTQVTNEPILSKLEQRLGRLYGRQRLGIERDHEAQIFGQGINFFRMTLKLTGLYWRGIRNAQRRSCFRVWTIQEGLPFASVSNVRS